MKKFFVYIFLLFLCLKAVSQSNSISGTVNDYYKVVDVTNDYVELSSSPSLLPGDKVVLMQMTGVRALPSGAWPTSNLSWANIANGGRYEMLAVNNVSGNRVYFTVTLNSSNYRPGEKIQLVKIYEADYATVTGQLTAKEWDDSTGGVVALVIFKKLTLNYNIEASNRGFQGGQPEPDFVGGCRENPTDDYYIDNSVLGTAGLKGEGLLEQTYTTYSTFTKGPGNFISGGGGGLGYFAGGGGGSHMGAGGNGGDQIDGCTTYQNAVGGENLSNLYSDAGKDRITMGGGGGSSTEDATYSATKGGDGGGIVIIMTDTLLSNNRSINSSGESVSGIATAGAGGGGAGGAIFLDVNVYSGNLNVDVHGGTGGSTGAELTGAGGGGGGGIIRYSGSSLPGNVTTDVSLGAGGSANLPEHRGGSGSNGALETNLQLPLNGFLFNTIDGPDTICEGQQPKLITASIPRGKSTSYIYEWLQSTDDVNWVTAVGTGDSLSFQPDEITETTYYTRVVLDTLTDESDTPPEKYVYDTAFSIEVFVYPQLTGNSLDFNDTLCFDQSPGTLVGDVVGGGDTGNYEYNWHSSINNTNWTTNRSLDSFLNEVNLTQTTYYRRIVTSHKVCVDTSNTDSITVLPNITNNIFTPIADTAICEGSDAGLVRASTPSQLGGGDENYTFKWMESADDDVYSIIDGAGGVNYPPGVLTDNMYYKRIVYSGSDTVCKSTTETSFYVEVYDLISQNSIVGSNVQYVCHSSAKTLTGSDPAGGNGTYAYVWEEWVDGSGWEGATGSNNDRDYTSPSLTDTISYRRLVTSGDFAQCQDMSEAVLIRINELPTGDIEEGVAAFCEQGTLVVNYSNLTGNGPWVITVGDESPIYTSPSLDEPSGSFSLVDLTESASIRVLELEDDSSCVAADSIFENIVELTIYERPDPNAGDDPEACGLTGNMAAQPSVGDGVWAGENVVFDDPTNSNSGVSAAEYGTYSVTWTETNGECIETDETEITFYQQPMEADAGEDQILDYQFSTTLDAQPATIGNGTWRFETGGGSFEDSTLYNTVVDFSDIGTHELSWTIVNGSCEPVSNSVQIVIGDLAIFNGFSPNGDGVNDEFILNMSGRNTSKLIVLDKWGGLVIEIEGTDELRWNGDNKNGNPVQVGTYFYIIKEEGLPDRKGYIELRR